MIAPPWLSKSLLCVGRRPWSNETVGLSCPLTCISSISDTFSPARVYLRQRVGLTSHQISLYGKKSDSLKNNQKSNKNYRGHSKNMDDENAEDESITDREKRLADEHTLNKLTLKHGLLHNGKDLNGDPIIDCEETLTGNQELSKYSRKHGIFFDDKDVHVETKRKGASREVVALSPYLYHAKNKSFDNFNLDALVEEMKSHLSSFKKELGTIRLGRASPKLLDPIMVIKDHTSIPLTSLAQTYTKDAYTMVIKVHDPTNIKEVEKAIQDSHLDLLPQRESEATLILSLPKPTQDMRDKYIKNASKLAELYKGQIRVIRREAINDMNKNLAEDDAKRAEKEIHKQHNIFLKDADDLLEGKKKEITNY